MEDEYIRMCEAAVEVQSYWSIAPGDRVYLKTNLFFDDNKLTPVRTDELVYKEGMYYVGSNDKTYMEFTTFFDYCFPVPYQHQLQDWAQRSFESRRSMLWAFMDFVLSKSTKYTLDMLWLMFYYEIVHQREWNNEEWERHEKGHLYSYRRD
jgi:hypothetical protein